MQDVIKRVSIHKVPFNQLVADEQQLFEYALQVRDHAQAPYSNYKVGVALISNQGTIHVGCNVERCTWTQTTHAEQSAIDAMIAALGPAKIEKLAVVGAPAEAMISLPDTTGIPLTNVVCGHCLQIIWENSFEDPAVKVLNLESDGIVSCATIDDLLPFRFGPGGMGISYITN